MGMTPATNRFSLMSASGSLRSNEEGENPYSLDDSGCVSEYLEANEFSFCAVRSSSAKHDTLGSGLPIQPVCSAPWEIMEINGV